MRIVVSATAATVPPEPLSEPGPELWHQLVEVGPVAPHSGRCLEGIDTVLRIGPVEGYPDELGHRPPGGRGDSLQALALLVVECDLRASGHDVTPHHMSSNRFEWLSRPEGCSRRPGGRRAGGRRPVRRCRPA